MSKKNKVEKDSSKAKLSEKFTLAVKRKWLVNGTKTFIIIAVLVLFYIAINIYVAGLDLPEIDITANKIYTLSDASKEVISKVDQEINIYAYGFSENSAMIKFLKQYANTNDKISYEILTPETNMQKIQENDLTDGYTVLILESGDSKKVIDASTDFQTFDYTTYQTIDTTEQTITNSILSLTQGYKPVVYFVTGHNEFSSDETQVLQSYLKNESFDVKNINLATQTEIPKDCDVLVILSPSTDFLDYEVPIIKDYINKGGNIYFSMDVISETLDLPNVQSVLDEYGVSVKNGYILEYNEEAANPTYPYIFMPAVSGSNEITSEIYSDSYMWLAYSAKLNSKSDEELENMRVSKEVLLSSSDQAIFVSDLSSDMATAAQTAEAGTADIAALMSKDITFTNEAGDQETVTSKLVVSATGSFASDYIVSELSASYPISYIGSNKDFVINSLSHLAGKENSLTIRKDMANSTYLPTETQNRIVTAIIVGVPFIIILIGVMIGHYRKKRK